MSRSHSLTSSVIGRFNRLQIVKNTEQGLYLWSGKIHGEILLPKRYIQREMSTETGAWLEVFVYLDNEGRPVATTEKPYAQVGEFADLEIVSINQTGIFLDWGLPKDVLMPYSETREQLAVGNYCIVYLYLDPRHGRITATAKIDRHLDRTPARYHIGQKVQILVAAQTPMGYKAIINHTHWGLIHKNELFKTIMIGTETDAYIKEVRPDGKVSLSLQPVDAKAGISLEEVIMEKLEASGGQLMISDTSTPSLIADTFNVSKSNFKKAIGGLYRKGLIIIEHDRIVKATDHNRHV